MNETKSVTVGHHAAPRAAAVALAAAQGAATPTLAQALESTPFSAVSWNGMAGPVGTPKPVIDRLHAEVKKAVNSPAIQERLVGNGFVVDGRSIEKPRSSSAPRWRNGAWRPKQRAGLWTSLPVAGGTDQALRTTST